MRIAGRTTTRAIADALAIGALGVALSASGVNAAEIKVMSTPAY